jgi:hypothetical protein
MPAIADVTPRLLVALLLLAVAGSVGCGQDGRDDASPPPDEAADVPGTTRVEVGAFSFAAPADWEPERQGEPPAQTLAAYTGPPMTAGVTPQVGLGAGPDYPNSLEEAVELNKLDAKTRYPEYRIVDERPVEVAGARAYRVDSTYQAFTEEPATVRMVTILAQTPDRWQANLFVRAAEADFERLGLERLAMTVSAE